MSSVNWENFKLKKRRHPTQHISQDEITVDKLNQVVDEANDKIAKIAAYSANLEKQVTLLLEENKDLRQQIAELEKDNAKLKKQVKPKAGKRRDEWEDS